MPNPPPHRPLIARHVVSLLPWSAAALAYAITPAVFGGGDGTAANPFRIGSPQHLENLRDALGTANEACVTGVHHYRQTRSLDLSDRADWTRGIGYGIEGLDSMAHTVPSVVTTTAAASRSLTSRSCNPSGTSSLR